MLRQSLAVGLLAVTPILGAKCDTHFDPSLVVDDSDMIILNAAAPAPPATNIFVHVVAASQNRADGYLTAAEVDKQVQVIKDLFQPQGITFNHNANTMRKWYNEPKWTGDSRSFDDMKEALHQGDYRTLNLYLRHITLEDYGGSCSNPWYSNRTQPNLQLRLKRDGCVVNSLTIPGSTHPFMNQGKTAVHEIGHWFGLWHPFEDQGVRAPPNPVDTCWSGNPDDDVADTPKMKMVGIGTCDENQDSCKDAPGKDPVHNYMAYSSDSCMTEFTPGQRELMYSRWESLRKSVTIA